MAKKNSKLKYTEIVQAGRDILTKYGLSNENPDKLIARKGMKYIEEIERDTHLASCLATRRQKLIKKGWRIKPASRMGKVTARNQEIAEFVEYCLRNMEGSLEKDIEGMLDAIGKGYSLTEINYMPLTRGKWRGKIGLKSLRFKPARYFSFRFDKFGHWEIIQIDPDPRGVTLPKEKFIHLIAGPNDENPYGDGVSSKCAFWVWLKKNEAKFWAIFSERFGMPLVKGKKPRKATPDEEQKIKEIIENIQTESGVAIPEGFDVEFLEATRSGDVGYDNFIERCNKEISKIVLGATLISEEGKRGQGSYALGSTHVSVLEDYIVFDAAITAEAINEQLIKRLVDYNFQTDEYPRFEWLGIEISGLISLAQSLGILVDKGFRIPLSWVYEKTGIPIPREGEEVLQGGSFLSPMTPVGKDNRSPASFEESFGEIFAELPDDVQEEIREIDHLHQRYLRLAETQRESILKKIQASVKKKVL